MSEELMRHLMRKSEIAHANGFGYYRAFRVSDSERFVRFNSCANSKDCIYSTNSDLGIYPKGVSESFLANYSCEDCGGYVLKEEC